MWHNYFRFLVSKLVAGKSEDFKVGWMFKLLANQIHVVRVSEATFGSNVHNQQNLEKDVARYINIDVNCSIKNSMF